MLMTGSAKPTWIVPTKGLVIKNHQKSLQPDPRNTHATEMQKKLDDRSEAGGLVLVAVHKKMGNRDEYHGPERRGRERIPEAAAEYSELYKNPAANEGAD